MSEAETIWLTEDTVEELSAFLAGAFTLPAHRFLFSPEVLRWKYLEPSGFGGASRSLFVRENGRMVAHVGLHFTAFDGVSAVHPYDWVASGTRSPHGLLLLMRMHRMADLQYVLGCTEVAAQVYARCGYCVVMVVPLFQKVVDPLAWRHIHRCEPWLKRTVLLALDRSRSRLNPGGVPRREVELRSTPVFGMELKDVVRRAPALIHSSRDPEALNHFLRYPVGTIRGWHVVSDGQVRGFALTNIIRHDPVCIGKILECYLDTSESDLWQAAVYALTNELRARGCQHLLAYGGAPWTAEALRANGFFERGHTALQWRDVKEKIALDRPLHLTYLEADTGLL